MYCDGSKQPSIFLISTPFFSRYPSLSKTITNHSFTPYLIKTRADRCTRYRVLDRRIDFHSTCGPYPTRSSCPSGLTTTPSTNRFRILTTPTITRIYGTTRSPAIPTHTEIPLSSFSGRARFGPAFSLEERGCFGNGER